MAYRVTIARGQRLTAEVTLNSSEQTRVFIDLFRVPADEDDPLRPVFSSDSVPGDFAVEPWRGGEYVLRLQPELLRGGTYGVTLTVEAQLAFPVEGYGMRGVQSIFGVERDGGRRSHAGVDIFARRGTPVLAAAAGRVNRVGITNLGGKVVVGEGPRSQREHLLRAPRQSVRAQRETKSTSATPWGSSAIPATRAPRHPTFTSGFTAEAPWIPSPS